MGSRQAKLPRRIRAAMNAARCSEGPREAVACAPVSCGGGPRASLRVASEREWNCEWWARMGGWEERGLPAARVLKGARCFFFALAGCASEGWLTLTQRDFRGPTGSVAALWCGPPCARRSPTGDWQRDVASARRCSGAAVTVSRRHIGTSARRRERERVDKNARILWISAAISGDCPIDAKCDQGFSGAGPTRGREYARFCL